MFFILVPHFETHVLWPLCCVNREFFHCSFFMLRVVPHIYPYSVWFLHMLLHRTFHFSLCHFNTTLGYVPTPSFLLKYSSPFWCYSMHSFMNFRLILSMCFVSHFLVLLIVIVMMDIVRICWCDYLQISLQHPSCNDLWNFYTFRELFHCALPLTPHELIQLWILLISLGHFVEHFFRLLLVLHPVELSFRPW